MITPAEASAADRIVTILATLPPSRRLEVLALVARALDQHTRVPAPRRVPSTDAQTSKLQRLRAPAADAVAAPRPDGALPS